ncbi:hypothetical protein FEE95_11520 [Maribacter algarum]|uniref:Uncharacterized protein n=1 Tax=Maribacter algarum (ex Zhang et al. 2020) TaxID=2578118 RepID=A0A5S3PT71_9FLAO|nr:hypothetical protein [Maribacter algarum]TMM57113.1 hypothetical protein FEE95_11520 [Maribacter algarum]
MSLIVVFSSIILGFNIKRDEGNEEVFDSCNEQNTRFDVKYPISGTGSSLKGKEENYVYP